MDASFQPLSSEPPRAHRTFGKKILLIIVSIFLVLLLIFIAFVGYYLIKIARGHGDSLAKQFRSTISTDASLTGISDTQITQAHILSTIRKHNAILGQKDAPITIVAFIDFTCPYTQQSYPIITRIIEQYGSAARIVIKHFPIDSIRPEAKTAALAATCAQQQNKFWEYYHQLFLKKQFDETGLKQTAQALSLSPQFANCLSAATYDKQIQEDLSDGMALGVRGTPTYFVNDTKIEGVFDEKTWQDILLKEL